jgi:MarR family transcriptional regulator, organic hydroperoxide resistance regulator
MNNKNKLREGGLLITKTHQLANRTFDKKLREYRISELSGAQGRILFTLWDTDNISISELSRKTLLEKSTLTVMLDRLEKNGYIKRLPEKYDRRKIMIKRTEKDKEFQKLFLKISEEMSELFYKDISDDEIDLFESTLNKILGNLISYQK